MKQKQGGNNMKDDEIRKVVREGYAQVARERSSCCGPADTACGTAADTSRQMGYSDEEMTSVPEGANLGLGCGNPVALAALKAGQVVVDLGSGAGFDCFLAAQKVGPQGKVIGVDMTPDMLDKARKNAGTAGVDNVEFRLGEIENLPVANNTADTVISNCVINLSPDKHRVFREAFRVLKPSGRLMVSDIVLLAELPRSIRQSLAAYVGCISGALLKDEYLAAVAEAGFTDIAIVDEATFPIKLMTNDPTAQSIVEELNMSDRKIEEMAVSVVSLKVSGFKPKG
jgi:SAM-dependent methyltransferase